MRKARSDREFLPAALSILETPPSPVKVWLIWAICACSPLLCLELFRPDRHHRGGARQDPAHRPREDHPARRGGKVVAIHVENGKHVARRGSHRTRRRGSARRLFGRSDCLAELPRRASAPPGGVRRCKGRIDRRPRWSGPRYSRGHARARRACPARRPQAARGKRQKPRGAAFAKEGRAKAPDRNHRRAADTRRHAARARDHARDAAGNPVGSKAAVIDAQETLQIQQTALATQKGQLAEAIAAAEVLAQERQKAIETFKAENGQKLADAGRQIDDYAQKTAKTGVKLDHMTIKSPISGMVLGVSVTTLARW